MRLFIFATITAALLLFSVSAFAASRYDILYMRPNPAGGPYFSVLDSETLKQWRSTFGTSLSYSYGSFDLVTAGVKQFSVVDHLFVQDIFGAVGLTDWLEAGFDLPVVWWERFRSPDVAAPSAESITNIGDLKIQLKGKILDTKNFGLALAGFVQPQTGKASTFLGNESVSGGALLAMDFKSGDRFIASLNAGTVFRDHVVYRNVDFQNLLNLGAAVDVRIYKGLHIQSEMWNSTPLDDPWKNKETTVLEADGGLTWHIGDTGFTLRGLAGGGFYHGLGSPIVRGTIGMNYLLPEDKKSPLTPPSTVKGEEDKEGLASDVVHFAFDSARVSRGEAQKLDEIIELIKSRPEIKDLRLEGHADSIGSYRVNKAVSLARAKAVRTYLIRHGVSGVELTTAGFGSTVPKSSNATATGRRENRRVEIFFEPRTGE